MSVISAIRSTTKLAPCSEGEAAPANNTSASTNTRGLTRVVIVLAAITLALLAQAAQKLLGAQTRLDSRALDLARQLRHHRHHWRQHKYAVQVDQAKRIARLN